MIEHDDVLVLHVDDEPAFGRVAGEFLERSDDRLEVVTTTSAEEGLTILDSRAIDCVVSDYDMPRMDGIEFLDRVRAEHGDIPFLLFTGKGSEEVASEAISAGVTDYLQKTGGTDQYTVLSNRITNAVEAHRSRMALEESRNRLSSLFEQSPLAIVEWDQEFRVIRWNRKAEEIFGFSAEEMVGRKVDRFIPEEERDVVAEVMDQLLAETGGYHSVNENLTADGDVITCEWHNRVLTDEDEEVVSVISLGQDVTERERRKRRLETLVETVPGIIYRALNEPDWPMEYVGGECERITGYTAEQLESGEVVWGESVLHPEDRERSWEVVQRALENDEPFELTYRIVDARGEERRVWERGKVVRGDDGSPEVLEGFITDVAVRDGPTGGDHD